MAAILPYILGAGAGGLLGGGGGISELLKAFLVDPKLIKIQSKAAQAMFQKQMDALGMMSSKQHGMSQELLGQFNQFNQQQHGWDVEASAKHGQLERDLMGMQGQQTLGAAALGGLSNLASAPAPMIPPRQGGLTGYIQSVM